MPTHSSFCSVGHMQWLSKHGPWNCHSCQLWGPRCDSFLHAEGHSLNEIHCQLCCVYRGIVSDSSVRDWGRNLRVGTDVHNKGRQDATQLWLMNSFRKLTKLHVRSLVSWFQIFVMAWIEFQRLICFKLSQFDFGCHKFCYRTMDLTAGGNGNYRVHIYSFATHAQLNKNGLWVGILWDEILLVIYRKSIGSPWQLVYFLPDSRRLILEKPWYL